MTSQLKLKANKMLVVVTGASRGIGRELALQVAKYFSAPAAGQCFFVLLARDEAAVDEVKDGVLKEFQIQNIFHRNLNLRIPSATVVSVLADLEKQPFPALEDIETQIRTFEGLRFCWGINIQI